MIQLLVIDIMIALSIPGPGEISPDSVDSFDENQCIECHGDLIEHEVMHMPAADACDNCHESTGAPHPGDTNKGFSLVDSVPDLCYYCHEEPADQVHTHRPVAESTCLTCHDAHGSSEFRLLKLPEVELCLSCHNRDYTTDTSATGNIRRLIRGKAVAHSAITGGGCITCHLAHGSDYRALLMDQYPEEDYIEAKTENFGLCFLCHDTDILDAVETEWATNFRDGTRNLHQLHINGNKGRNCRMCHNLHGSPQRFLIEGTVGFGNWEMEMNFIPEENGGSCLTGCHGKLTYKR